MMRKFSVAGLLAITLVGAQQVLAKDNEPGKEVKATVTAKTVRFVGVVESVTSEAAGRTIVVTGRPPAPSVTKVAEASREHQASPVHTEKSGDAAQKTLTFKVDPMCRVYTAGTGGMGNVAFLKKGDHVCIMYKQRPGDPMVAIDIALMRTHKSAPKK